MSDSDYIRRMMAVCEATAAQLRASVAECYTGGGADRASAIEAIHEHVVTILEGDVKAVPPHLLKVAAGLGLLSVALGLAEAAAE